MSVMLGFGVLLDYSDRNTTGKTFCSYAHQIYPERDDAERIATALRLEGQAAIVVEVRCDVPGSP